MAYSQTDSHPGFTLQDFEVDSNNQELNFILTHPFIRSRSFNLSGRYAFDAKNARTKALGGELFEDRLRVMRWGGSVDFVDGFRGVNLIESTISRGFDGC